MSRVNEEEALPRIHAEHFVCGTCCVVHALEATSFSAIPSMPDCQEDYGPDIRATDGNCSPSLMISVLFSSNQQISDLKNLDSIVRKVMLDVLILMMFL